MRLIATALLVVMAALFAAAVRWQQAYPELAWLRAFAEAGMIGGLADWFAVTAIFRRPLGLPIPHTAIVPTQKARIGRDLGDFVQRNFLSAETIAAKVLEMDPAARLAAWLADPAAAARLADCNAAIITRLVNVLNDSDVKRLVEANLLQALREVHAAPMAGTVLCALLESDKEGELLQGLTGAIGDFLDANEEFLQEHVEREMPWYLPGALRHRVFRRTARRFRRRLALMHEDRRHPARVKLTSELKALGERMKHDPDFAARGEAWKKRVLESEGVQTWIAQLAKDMQAALLHGLAKEPGQGHELALRVIVSLGAQLQDDAALQAKINAVAAELVRSGVTNHGHEIAQLVAGTVRSWDTRTTVEKIELHVGRDLQYVRLNGTLVGGLVGVLIRAVLVFVVER